MYSGSTSILTNLADELRKQLAAPDDEIRKIEAMRSQAGEIAGLSVTQRRALVTSLEDAAKAHRAARAMALANAVAEAIDDALDIKMTVTPRRRRRSKKQNNASLPAARTSQPPAIAPKTGERLL